VICFSHSVINMGRIMAKWLKSSSIYRRIKRLKIFICGFSLQMS
jgi:hypothetical protein